MRTYFLIAWLLSHVLSCTEHKQLDTIKSDDVRRVDTVPGQCPYLTRDTEGRTILSWVRTDSAKMFCYAVADGEQLGKPISIPGTGNIQPHGENLPKIIFKPSGEVIALWGVANPNKNNKYSGLVYYTQSFDKGATWNDARPLVTDTGGYDQRYYDVALLPDGEVGIVWLDNRKSVSGEGSGLYFARTNGSAGFGEGRRISEPCCPCCRTKLYIDKKGGIHAIYRAIINDSIRDMVHIVSDNDGISFSQPVRIRDDNWVIDGCPHTGPALTENANGLHFAWFTGAGRGGCSYVRSNDEGPGYRSYDSISTGGSHPQMAALSDDRLVIVWDEFIDGAGKRIGVQLRDANGNHITRSFVTAEGENASYPVVTAIGEGMSIVAYTAKKNDKSFVCYRTVRL